MLALVYLQENRIDACGFTKQDMGIRIAQVVCGSENHLCMLEYLGTKVENHSYPAVLSVEYNHNNSTKGFRLHEVLRRCRIYFGQA